MLQYRIWCPSAISGGTLSKQRPFNNSVIFCSVWLKFGTKTNCRMGNDVATPPQRYNIIFCAAAPFLAAPPSKRRPFNSFVIFLLPIRMKGRRQRHTQNDTHSLTLSFFAQSSSNSGQRQIVRWGVKTQHHSHATAL